MGASHALTVKRFNTSAERKRKRYTLSPLPEPKKPPPPLSQPAESQPRPAPAPTEWGPPQLDVQSTNPEVPESTPYLGRGDYINGDVQIDEETAKNYPPPHHATLPDIDMKILQMQHAFDLPPISIRNKLIDDFMLRCSPWMPIVSRSRLENESSILLQQAVFLAASRISSEPLAYASCEELYRRAKALFFSGYEKSTMTVITAICLMQWWNPSGPEHVSMDTSAFWLRMGVALAVQIGLHREPRPGTKDAAVRRRLWWTLRARDCLISSGQGRPRAIDHGDCDVRPLTLDDFSSSEPHARLFVAYVQVCTILGNVTESYVRGDLSRSKRVAIETDVTRWIRELPEDLHIYSRTQPRRLAPYNFEARQLHIPYFTILSILYRTTSPNKRPQGVAVLASSFIAGIFDDFVARDELRFLGPIFTFYLLVAGIQQLSCYRFADLRATSERELETIKVSLRELGKTWPSAFGPQNVIQRLSEAMTRQPPGSTSRPASMCSDQLSFFSMFGPELCPKWSAIFCNSHNNGGRNNSTSTNITSASSSNNVSCLNANGSMGATPGGNCSNAVVPATVTELSAAGTLAGLRTPSERETAQDGGLQMPFDMPTDVLQPFASESLGLDIGDRGGGFEFFSATDSAGMVGNWLLND
ncbi:MAG: hypothetical protein M1819_001706 [Sarea resinae]|nr:MAG: hypothetical protein M1819_001706 [Sarea resinae]